jgi:C1A family cysteine protease
MMGQKKGSEFPMVLTVVVTVIIGIIAMMFFSANSNLFGQAGKTGNSISGLYTESTEIPFTWDGEIINFTIDADVELNAPDSLVRIILVDENNNEYLVYEAFPLIEGTNQISIKDACEETCAIPGIVASAAKIIVNDASITIKSYSINSEKNPDAKASLTGKAIKSSINSKKKLDYNAKVSLKMKADKIKAEKEAKKIEKINKRIGEKSLTWLAGETTISKMSYNEKRKLFGLDEKGEQEMPNLQGFEYYKGGVFVMPSAETADSPTGNLITDRCKVESECPQEEEPAIRPEVLYQGWDWRIAHGENWMTPAKDQGQCGSCYAFAAIGSAEARINLYYNQHLNINLSEEHLIKIVPGGCSGSYPYNNPYEGMKKGITTEQCSPYIEPNGIYTLCPDWKNKLWKISDYYRVSDTDDNLKLTIRSAGPISFLLNSWWHRMVLIGYDSFENGVTIWIVKNSWGEGWGERGYARMVLGMADIDYVYGIYKPYFVPNPGLYTRKCVNKDGDNYCNWGLGSSIRPVDCPISCRGISMDCDDSNSNIGGECYSTGVAVVPLSYPWGYICNADYASRYTYCKPIS